jgi:Putative DNA-binding domain
VLELADFQLAFTAAMGRSGGGALERQPGFAVYRNTTPNALIETLHAGYPVTAELLGEDAFAILALDFAKRRPPAHPVLLDYGAAFAHFLAAQPWIAEELPYLPDVAEIERLRTEAHIAADATPLGFADLARLGTETWPSLRLPLHPATRFAWLRTPALTIWEAHQQELPGAIEPEWRAEGALVTRPHDAVATLPIDAPAHRFLAGLRVGETVGRAAGVVARLYPDADIAGLFSILTQQGAFARPPALERTH